MVREISGLSIEENLSPDSSIISSTPIVDKQRRKRRKACLTTQGSKRRNLADNELLRVKRENESVEERSLRLQQMSDHAVYMRANETDAERSIRLQDMTEHAVNIRANETDAERSFRLHAMSDHAVHIRANERDAERSLRLQDMADHAVYIRANETDAERSFRLAGMANSRVLQRQGESIEEREIRLALRRQRDHDRQFQSPTYRIADIPRRAMYEPDFRPHYLGLMDNVCQYCKALFYATEGTISKGQLVYKNCCHGGKLANLPVIKQHHPVLIKLLEPLLIYNIERKHFLENIRQYNSLLAFGGVQTNFDKSNWDNRYNNRYRPFIYKCHGNMYFNVPPLFNEPNCPYKPQTAQFYVMDADIANNQRVGAWRNDNGLINNQVNNLF